MYNYPSRTSSMRFYKTQNAYKASNCVLNVANLTAYSYGWWRFVDKVKGKVIFNNYSYSPSTCAHQRKVKQSLSELGIKIDLYIDAPKGLQNLDVALTHYLNRIQDLTSELTSKRLQQKTKVRKLAEIERAETTIKEIKKLMKARK